MSRNEQDVKEFIPPRDRDAYATIRGYVYQVDTTILRWISMLDDEFLVLECGEDIDKVSNAFFTNEKMDRILEQIKHRKSKLTLRSPECVEAIANFAQHRASNPDLNIRFLFTTTAFIGLERPSPFKDKLAAIEVWESLRRRAIPNANVEERTAGIRKILKSASKPNGVADSTWSAYQEIVSGKDTADLLNLISRFQWSTGAADADSISNNIRIKMMAEGLAFELADAQSKYERLFLFVFKLLCKPDKKILSPAEKEQQLAMPSLKSQDKLLLNRIVKQVTNLNQRVEMLENGHRHHEDLLETVQGKMRELTQNMGIRASVVFRYEKLLLEPPPPLHNCSLRKKTVQKLNLQISHCTWTALRGGAGSGKTQLLVLVAEFRKNCKAWIRLRDLDVRKAAQRLDLFCSTAAELHEAENSNFSLVDIFEKMNADDFIVVDDMPRILADDELSVRLSKMVREAAEHDVRILSNSVSQLPRALKEELGSLIIEIEMPPLTEKEAREILETYDPPIGILEDQMVGFFNLLARGNPSLLTAVARYLKKAKWKFSLDLLKDLFHYKHMEEMNDETTARLILTVQEEETRNLLYRLNLVNRSFTEREVKCVAGAFPKIDRVRERLSSLNNLWLQKDVSGRIHVSPLIKALDVSDLEADTAKECRKLLADQIVQKRMVTHLDALDAIIYYVDAGYEQSAAFVFLTALLGLQNAPANVFDGGLLLFWQTTPLPKGINNSFRLFIRGLQISVLEKFNRDFNYALKDFDDLISDATEEMALSVVAGAMTCIFTVAKIDVKTANRYIAKTLNLYPLVVEQIDWKWEGPEELIWVSGSCIKTKDELDDWISLLEGMSEKQLNRAFSGSMGIEGSGVICMRLPLLEDEKPAEQQDWEVMLSVLDDLERRSEILKLESLWAGAVRAKMFIYEKNKKDLKGAENIARFVLEKKSVEPVSEFIVRSALGECYVNHKRWTQGAKELEASIRLPVRSLPVGRFNANLYCGVAVAQTDAIKSLKYFREAVSIADQTEHFPETEKIQALCELTVAEWLSDDMTECFSGIDRAADMLFDQAERTDRWKELVVLFGHCAGFLCQIATSGLAPTVIENGSPYVAPHNGMFLTENPVRVDLYEQRKKTHPDSIIMAQIAMFAEAIGDHERSVYWALRGMDEGRKSGLAVSQSVLSEITIPHLLQKDELGAALDAAVEAGIVFVSTGLTRKKAESTALYKYNPQEILGKKPNENWKQVDSYAVNFGLIPAVLRISTVAIKAKNKAMVMAKDLIGICRLLKDDSVDKALWRIAAESVEKAFSFESPLEELIKEGNAISNEQHIAIKAIFYMTATIQDDSIPENAILVHLSLIGYLLPMFKKHKSTYHRIILPFFSEFWQNAFEQSRFRFKSPKEFEFKLSEHKKLPIDQQLPAIIHAAADGLGVTLNTAQKTLLSTKK